MISFETARCCFLKAAWWAAWVGNNFVLRAMVSSRDLLALAVSISGVINGLLGRKDREEVLSGACLSSNDVSVDVN